MRKKLLAGVMAGAMVVGTLAGCGSSSHTTTTAAKEESTAAKTETTAAASKEEGTTAEGKTEVEPGPVVNGGSTSWEPFAENVQIQIPVYDRGATEFGPVDDNYWTQYIQKEFGDKYNITVKYVSIPRGDVMTKYNQLIATRDNTVVPTIFMEYDYPKLSQWADDGALQEIDYDQFKEIAPNYYAKMEELGLLDYTSINDTEYFAFAERPYYDTTYTFINFVRMDWLEKVGYDHVPQSYEEYTDAMTKIAEAGLSGDTQPIGASLNKSSYILDQGFFPKDGDDREFAMHASLATANMSWEPCYLSLKRSNAEYNAGWVTKEFELDSDGSQAKANFIAGKTYSYGGYMSAAGVDWLYSFYEQNPDAKLAVASNYTGVDGTDNVGGGFRPSNPFGMIIGFSSVATADQVKAAEMYMEWMRDDDNLFILQNGFEGKTYKIDENGNPELIADYDGEEKLNQNANKDLWCVAKEARIVGSTPEEAIKAVAPVGTPQDEEILAGMIKNYEEQKAISDAGYAFVDPMFGVVIASESEYSATLASLWQEYYVQLTKCAPEEFDALYAELSQKYLDAGYQEIIDERALAYDEGHVVIVK